MVRIYFFIAIVITGPMVLSTPATAGQYKPGSAASRSPVNVLMLDLAIPGYGMFVHNKPFWGLSYTGLKLAGAFLIYAAIRNHNYWASVAASANSYQNSQPGFVYFKDPTDSSKALSALDIQNKADSSFLFIIYAVAFELTVFTISGWHSYSTALEEKKSNGPFYRMSYQQASQNNQYMAGWQQSF